MIALHCILSACDTKIIRVSVFGNGMYGMVGCGLHVCHIRLMLSVSLSIFQV